MKVAVVTGSGRGIGRVIVRDLAANGFAVNCISPGWIETNDYDRLKEADHAQHFSGRVGKPSDNTRACLLLVENDFINGENIIIDGGMTMKMIYEP